MSSPSFTASLKGLPVILLPALLALALILLFAVDVPLMDEWDTPLRLYVDVIESGHLDFYDHLFSQHNESRDVFPRLIFFVIGFAVGWHGPIFMVMSWACVLLTLLLLLNLLSGHGGTSPSVFLYSGALISALLFSIAQWQNQLWGIQLIMFIPSLCLASCLWIQSMRTSFRVTVWACALLSVIATFSYANGMVCWLLGFPFLTVWMTNWKSVSRRERNQRIVSIVLYLILATLTLSFYFWDYHKPLNTPSFSFVLEYPVLALQYFVTWIGAPFVPEGQTLLAMVLGSLVALLVTVSSGMVYIARKHSGDVLKDSYPWICLMAYGIVTGLTTIAGRGGWGPESAVVPRYSTFSLWVTIGLVGLLTVILQDKKIQFRLVPPAMIRLGIVMVSLLTLSSWVHGFADMQMANRQARQNLLTLRLLHVAPSNPLLLRLYPNLAQIHERAAVLLEHDILSIELIGRWLSQKLHKPDGEIGGIFTLIGENEKVTEITGWAVFPEPEVSVDCVILARRNESENLDVVTGFVTEGRSSDVAPDQGGSSLRRVEFKDALQLPLTDKQHFTMFAVDLKDQRVYELQRDRLPSHHASHTISQLGGA